MPEENATEGSKVRQPEQAQAPAAAQPRPQDQRGADRKFEGWLSEVVEIAGVRTGIYGEIKQAMCKILEGKDRGRVIRRNVAGQIRVGDIMRLPDTSREDKPIRSR